MKTIYLVCVLILISFSAKAKSFVYFQNNTSLDLNISTSSNLNKKNWESNFNGSFEAWKLQTKLFGVNRNKGITKGDNFILTSTIKTDTDSIAINLKLKGNLIGSNIWHSISGTNFSNNWQSDNQFYSEEFVMNEDTFILTYRSDIPLEKTHANFYFVLQEKHPYQINPKELNEANVLNILSYNVFMLTPPIGTADEKTRAKILHKYTKNFDAIILSEAFLNKARNRSIVPLLSQEYPYYTNIVDGKTIEDGGVMIFSKWPIKTEQQLLFTNCIGTDCFSSKGVMYAKINKLGLNYHIFGTHTQAWPDKKHIDVRLNQLRELNNFIEFINIPKTEAVIIGGDLNVNKSNVNPTLEYTPMLDILNVAEPSYLGRPLTYNIDFNAYAKGPKEYLDFVFCKKEYLQPIVYINTVNTLRHVEQINKLWNKNSLRLDISDHNPVHGRFVFPAAK